MAQASGIDTPTREDLTRIDKDRKNMASNDDSENPHDPEAKIAKMKDGTRHLAHKQEHAVDLDSGAVLAVSIQRPTWEIRPPGGRRWRRPTRTSTRSTMMSVSPTASIPIRVIKLSPEPVDDVGRASIQICGFGSKVI